MQELFLKVESTQICVISLQVYVVDATNPQSGLHRVNIRIPGVQYFLEHHHGFFYALTNQLPCGNNLLSTGNYYLIRCQVQDLQTAKWEVNFTLPNYAVLTFYLVITDEFPIPHGTFDGYIYLFLYTTALITITFLTSQN